MAAVASVKVGVKTAVTDLLASITRLVGLMDPLRSPSQPVNTQPGAGMAVTDTTSLER